jgi:hypothetical protein
MVIADFLLGKTPREDSNREKVVILRLVLLLLNLSTSKINITSPKSSER